MFARHGAIRDTRAATIQDLMEKATGRDPRSVLLHTSRKPACTAAKPASGRVHLHDSRCLPRGARPPGGGGDGNLSLGSPSLDNTGSHKTESCGLGGLSWLPTWFEAFRFLISRGAGGAKVAGRVIAWKVGSRPPLRSPCRIVAGSSWWADQV